MTRSADPDWRGGARTLALGAGATAARRSWLTPALLVLMPAVGLVASNPVLGRQATQADAEAERVSCGPRAVYELARRLGYDVRYQTIRSGMRLTDEGATIYDVKTALNDQGVACSVRRLDPTQLLSCPTPLIVHVVPHGYSKISDGHFLVVTRVGTDSLETFDPYLGRPASWAWSSFSDTWSGFAAVPEPSSAARTVRLALVALAVHLLSLAGLLTSIRPGVWRSLPALAGRGGVVVRAVLIIATSGLLASPAAGADEPLRSDSNDGANAAALLGGIIGVEIAPGRPSGGEAFHTLEEMRSFLFDHGVTSKVRRLTYDDLIHRTGPCIIPMRFGKGESGNFCVMVYANSEYVTLVRAGLLQVTSIPVDEFRRRWTGHALLPVRHHSPGTAYLAAAVGAAVIPALVYMVGRRGRQAAA